MLTSRDTVQMETVYCTKKDMEDFRKEFKDTLQKNKLEIITEIKKTRKEMSKWK